MTTAPSRAVRSASDLTESEAVGASVIVMCSIPNGHFLDLVERKTRNESVFGGGTREVVYYQRIPDKRILLRGPRHFARKDDRYSPERASKIVASDGHGNGYVMNVVPADFFNEWLRQNPDSDLIANKLLLWHEKKDHAIGESKDHKDTRTGFERMDADDKDDPRMRGLKGHGRSLSAIATHNNEDE